MVASRLSSLLLVVALGLAALSAFSAAPGDESEVRDFVDAFAESLGGAGRAEGVAAFYDADASHIGAEGERIQGLPALARHFETFVPPRSSLVFDVAHVSFISDRVALVDGGVVEIDGSRSGSGRGNEGAEGMRFVLVTRQSRDGWKIVASRMTLAPTPRMP